MVAALEHSKSDLTLASLAPGELAVVDRLEIGAEDAALLRAMGLCATCCVRMCRGGQPCIVAILTELGQPAVSCEGGQTASGDADHRSAGFACCASRIGLAQELASRIVVRRLAIA